MEEAANTRVYLDPFEGAAPTASDGVLGTVDLERPEQVIRYADGSETTRRQLILNRLCVADVPEALSRLLPPTEDLPMGGFETAFYTGEISVDELLGAVKHALTDALSQNHLAADYEPDDDSGPEPDLASDDNDDPLEDLDDLPL